MTARIKYALQNIKTKKYFKGYPGKGQGKKLANKPIWTNQISEALQLIDLSLATHTRRRLFCQSQLVELIQVPKEKQYESPNQS